MRLTVQEVLAPPQMIYKVSKKKVNATILHLKYNVSHNNPKKLTYLNPKWSKE